MIDSHDILIVHVDQQVTITYYHVQCMFCRSPHRAELTDGR